MEQQFEHLGEWIKYWRKEFGYTQPELGEAVGVSKQHISNLERRQQHGTSGAESNASIELLDKLSHLFSRPIKEARILAGYEKPNHIATVEEALNSAMFFNQKGLNENDKSELRPYLEILDREVERVQKKKVHIGSREDIQRFADETAGGGPFVKKIRKDEPMKNGDSPIDNLRPLKPKKSKKS